MGGNYVLILLLSFLVACQPYIQAVPTSQHQGKLINEISEKADTCASILCKEGQHCKNGNCVCPSGERMCGGECISEDACCTDDDCSSGNCEDGECAEAPECAYGEVLDDGECKCAPGKIFCREQGKCIDRGDCCVHSQCPRFERCVETNFRTSLCAKVGEKKVCKILADRGRTELYEIKGNTFRVGALKWLSDGSVEFNVSNEIIRLPENTTTSITGNITLFQEGIKVTGGFCKEDEDD